MKVCVITTAFPRWPGDAQAIFVWEAVRAIARRGVDIRVVAMHSPGTAAHEIMDGIPVHRPRYAWPESLELLRKGGAGGLPSTFEQHPHTWLLLPQFLATHTLAMVRHVRDCDLVHAHWTLSGACAAIARAIHKAPVLLTVHGSDIYRLPRLPAGRRFTRWVLTHCNQISAVSNSLRETTIALGANPEHICVVSNGVDTQRFTMGDDRREDTILYVGSFIERKGLRYLLHSLPGIIRHHPERRLVLVGEGPQYEELVALATRLGVADHVTFLPFSPQDQVARWMRRARLLVLPSIEEGQGVVLLEALASGTPIVASNVGGIPDVVTPDVGALVPPADPKTLGEAISRLMDDECRWLAASKAARSRAVQFYDWDHIAAQFVDLYEKTIARACSGKGAL